MVNNVLIEVFMKIIISFILFGLLNSCLTPNKGTSVSGLKNRVLELASWSNKKDSNVGSIFNFVNGKKLPREVSIKEWNTRYQISLRPIGEVEWVEYLEYNDGGDTIKIVLENGPLSASSSDLNRLEKYPENVARYINQSQNFDFSNVLIEKIYLIRP